MRFLKKLSRKTKITLIVIAIPLLVAVGVFGYWTLSPLFYNVEVSESLNESGTATTTLAQGQFIDADSFHIAEGTARVVSDGAQTLVRFEPDFKVRNGPDLFVWLVKDGDVNNGYVDLGKLKGNVGAQNYIVPEGTNLQEYGTVIVWCKAFSVLFGSAQLD